MKIKYRIIEVHPAEHSFVVRYYTDLITEEMLCAQFVEGDTVPLLKEDGTIARCRTDYNLTMYDDEMSEEDIDKFIRQSAPTDWLKMQEKNLGKTTDNMTLAVARVLAMKDSENEFVPEPPPVAVPTAPTEPTRAEIEAMVAKLTTPPDA